jgi:hypothetical protein
MNLIYDGHTISIQQGHSAEVIVWDCDLEDIDQMHTSTMCAVSAMKDVLLTLCGVQNSQADDYIRNSILGAYEAVYVFANTLYYPWNQVKAYALVLEDDGWLVTYVERRAE